jgi:hypothetical protein
VRGLGMPTRLLVVAVVILFSATTAHACFADFWQEISAYRIYGRVTDGHRPVEARFTVRRAHIAFWRWHNHSWLRGWGRVVYRGQSGADGAFEVPTLQPGNYEIQFSARPFRREQAYITVSQKASEASDGPLVVEMTDGRGRCGRVFRARADDD